MFTDATALTGIFIHHVRSLLPFPELRQTGSETGTEPTANAPVHGSMTAFSPPKKSGHFTEKPCLRGHQMKIRRINIAVRNGLSPAKTGSAQPPWWSFRYRPFPLRIKRLLHTAPPICSKQIRQNSARRFWHSSRETSSPSAAIRRRFFCSYGIRPKESGRSRSRQKRFQRFIGSIFPLLY